MNYQKELEACSQLLAEQDMTIAFAESATAGSVAAAFSKTEHSGAILKGGIVCYDACLKEDLLGISKELIERYTPESLEVTKAIAENLGKLIPADLSVGITGLTKPGGSETEEKPVGTMFIAIYTKSRLILDRSEFSGGEENIIRSTIGRICDLILEKLHPDDKASGPIKH